MTLVHVSCPTDGTVVTLSLDGDQLAPVGASELGDGVSVLVTADGVRGFARLKTPAAVVAVSFDGQRWRETHRRATDDVLHYLSLSSDGRWLLGVSYPGGFACVWPVAADGTVGEPTARVELRNPHSIVERDGFVYLASLGEDLVACYRLTSDGTLEPLQRATVAAPAGSGPRHLLVHPSGECVYCVTEFSGEVLRFARDTATGELELVQQVAAHALDRDLEHGVINGDPARDHQVWGADVHLLDGHLVASERTESTLTVLPVAPSGALGEQVSVAAAELQPRAFATTADGHLVCAGERSRSVGLYRLDGDELTLLGRQEVGRGGQWVTVVE